MKVAIVIDWLTEVGGAERVLLAIHRLYPDAPIYTSQYRPRSIDWFKDADVHAGWLNVFPRYLRKFMPPLRALYFKHLDLSNYDLVISVANAEAKGTKTGGHTVHISYLQGPPVQYYWGLYGEYIKNPGFGHLNFLARLGLKTLVRPMRHEDLVASHRPQLLLANSNYVAREIRKYYRRDSSVVYPPVNVREIQRLKVQPKNPFDGADFYVIAGRQVNWKRMDLAIRACRDSGRNLLVLGEGAEHEHLVQLAGDDPHIKFMPRYNGAAEIKQYLLAAKGFIFCSVEPFGISPVEALAAGCPVVALRYGGALDIIDEGVNGVFFDEQTAESLVQGMDKLEGTKFNCRTVEKSVEKFDVDEFNRNFTGIIEQELKRRGKTDKSTK